MSDFLFACVQAVAILVPLYGAFLLIMHRPELTPARVQPRENGRGSRD